MLVRVRRCAILMLEPRERLEFSLASIMSGGAGLEKTVEWIALVPHEDAETPVDILEMEILGVVSPSEWVEMGQLQERHSPEVLDSLLRKQLLVVEAGDADHRDRKLRSRHWRPASAIMHYASRWRGIGADDNKEDLSETLGGKLADWQGLPPPPVRERVEAEARLRLPKVESSAFEDLLRERTTCREFDSTRKLSLSQFSAVLFRAFGARAI